MHRYHFANKNHNITSQMAVYTYILTNFARKH